MHPVKMKQAEFKLFQHNFLLPDAGPLGSYQQGCMPQGQPVLAADPACVAVQDCHSHNKIHFVSDDCNRTLLPAVVLGFQRDRILGMKWGGYL